MLVQPGKICPIIPSVLLSSSGALENISTLTISLSSPCTSETDAPCPLLTLFVPQLTEAQ